MLGWEEDPDYFGIGSRHHIRTAPLHSILPQDVASTVNIFASVNAWIAGDHVGIRDMIQKMIKRDQIIGTTKELLHGDMAHVLLASIADAPRFPGELVRGVYFPFPDSQVGALYPQDQMQAFLEKLLTPGAHIEDPIRTWTTHQQLAEDFSRGRWFPFPNDIYQQHGVPGEMMISAEAHLPYTPDLLDPKMADVMDWAEGQGISVVLHMTDAKAVPMSSIGPAADYLDVIRDPVARLIFEDRGLFLANSDEWVSGGMLEVTEIVRSPTGQKYDIYLKQIGVIEPTTLPGPHELAEPIMHDAGTLVNFMQPMFPLMSDEMARSISQNINLLDQIFSGPPRALPRAMGELLSDIVETAAQTVEGYYAYDYVGAMQFGTGDLRRLLDDEFMDAVGGGAANPVTEERMDRMIGSVIGRTGLEVVYPFPPGNLAPEEFFKEHLEKIGGDDYVVVLKYRVSKRFGGIQVPSDTVGDPGMILLPPGLRKQIRNITTNTVTVPYDIESILDDPRDYERHTTYIVVEVDLV
jgi:hypothetical protein